MYSVVNIDAIGLDSTVSQAINIYSRTAPDV